MTNGGEKTGESGVENVGGQLLGDEKLGLLLLLLFLAVAGFLVTSTLTDDEPAGMIC